MTVDQYMQTFDSRYHQAYVCLHQHVTIFIKNDFVQTAENNRRELLNPGITP